MPVTMKQVTGSNSASSSLRVSIQQSLDGHSFSHPAPDRWPAAEGSEMLEVELILPHTVLVPEALFDPDAAREILAANGTPAGEEEQVVCCKPQNGVVALVAVDRALLEQLEGRYPGRLNFSTPLLHDPQKHEKTIWIARRENLLYVKVYRDGLLQLAEVIPAPGPEEITYFIERLGQLFPLADFELRLSGDEDKSIRKTFGKRFKTLLCE